MDEALTWSGGDFSIFSLEQTVYRWERRRRKRDKMGIYVNTCVCVCMYIFFLCVSVSLSPEVQLVSCFPRIMHSLWGRQRAMLYKWHCLNPCARSLALSFFRSLSPAPSPSSTLQWRFMAFVCMCMCMPDTVYCAMICKSQGRCCVKVALVFSHGRTFEIFWLFWIPAVLTSSLPAFPHLVHQSTPLHPPSLLWKLTSKLWPSYSWYTPLKHFSTCEGCWVPRVEDLLNLPTTSVFRRHLAYYPAITQPSPLPSFSLFPVLFLFVGWLTSWRMRLENMLNPP